MTRDCRAAHPARTSSNNGRVMALSSSFHDLLRAPIQLGNKGSHPFLINTAAEISLLPNSLAVETDLQLDLYIARQPVMVDGSSIRCEGMATVSIRL